MIIFNDPIHYQEEINIREMFKQLQYPYSYYSQLQLLYNNSQHFSTVMSEKNVCTHYQLQELAGIASSINSSEYVIVHGTIHTNYHSSNILKDANGLSLSGIDTYIRISLYDSQQTFMHILMIPPIVTIYSPTEILFSPSIECDMINTPIMPIIINAFGQTDIKTNISGRPKRAPLTITLATNQSIPLQSIIESPQPRAMSPKPKEKSLSPKPKEKSLSPKPKEKSMSPKPKEKSMSPKPKENSKKKTSTRRKSHRKK